MADQRGESRNGVSGARPTKEQVLADLQRMDAGQDVEGDTAGDVHGRDEDEADEHGRDDLADKPAKKRRASDKPVDDEDDEDEHGRSDASDEEDEEDEDDQDEDREQDQDGDDDDDEKDDGDKPDSELARRLANLKKTEKHQREKLDREYSKKNADLEAREKSIAEKYSAVESFEKLKARAKYDAAGVLRALGLTEDDFEGSAQQIYAHSKAAAAKPEHKAAAERAMRDRRLEDELANVKKDLEQEREERKKRDESAENAREAAKFVTEVTEEASVKKTPIVKRLLKRNPEGTRRELAAYAIQQAQTRGSLPSPRQVVRGFEKFRRAQLEDAGVDVDAMLASGGSLAAPKKGASNGNPKKKSANAGGDEGKAKTREQLRDELELELSELDLKERRKRAS